MRPALLICLVAALPRGSLGCCFAPAWNPLTTAKLAVSRWTGNDCQRKSACPIRMQGSDAHAKVRALNAWLQARGVLSTGAVEVGRCGASGLGLVATRTIEKGEVVAMVPRDVMLQTATAIDIPELQPAAGLVVGLLNEAWGWGGGGSLELGDVLLAVRLMHERSLGDMSDMAPWISALPAADDMQVPLLWGREEVGRLLRGCVPPDGGCAHPRPMAAARAVAQPQHGR
jgi:hypothetical protein